MIGGDRYADAWMIMSLLAIGFLFNGLAEYQLSVIVSLSKHKIPVHWEAISGVVGICTTILMIHLLGELGAPLGQLANYILLYLIGRTVVHHILVDRYGE